MERLRVARAAWAALATVLAFGLLLVPAAAAPAADFAPAGAGELLVDAAGWHGRPVRRPHDHSAVRTSTTSPPSGWSAGQASLGTGLSRPGGSRRVREVQRRLRRLGYATGRVDGIFGPRTRAALAWFQRKHRLPVTGATSPGTVRHLRERTRSGRKNLPADRPAPERPATQAPSSPAAARRPQPAPQPAPPVVRTTDAGSDTVPWVIAALLAGAGLALLAAGLIVQRRARLPQPALPAGAHFVPARAGAQSRRPRALGYVRLARGAPSASFHAQAAAIETGCRRRDITLVSLVSDFEPQRGAPDRLPALAFALERLESGDADRLVVSRLDHLAQNPEELTAVLESLAARRAALVVLDRDVDIAALPDPALASAVLDHHTAPPPARLDPAASGAIDAHIASMLDEGTSPDDAVAALNAEPVPPPNGGRWSRGGLHDAVRRQHRLHAAPKEHSDG